jgi:hypothetical protein
VVEHLEHLPGALGGIVQGLSLLEGQRVEALVAKGSDILAVATASSGTQ